MIFTSKPIWLKKLVWLWTGARFYLIIMQYWKNWHCHWSHHPVVRPTDKVDALEIQIHHCNPGAARNPIFNSVLSLMVVLNFTKINLINHLFVMLQMWSMTDTDENIHLFPLLLFCLCQILGHFFLIPHTDYSITVTNQNKQSWSGWSWWQPWGTKLNWKSDSWQLQGHGDVFGFPEHQLCQ